MGIETYVETPRLLNVLGEALFRHGKDDEALEVLRKINGQQSDDASYARIGMVLLRKGDYASSRAMLKDELVARFYEGSPDYIKALPSVRNQSSLEGAWLLIMGHIEDLRGQDEDALYFYNKALRVSPRNALLNLRLGLIHLRQSRFKQAARALDVASKEGTGRLKDQAARELVTAEALDKASKRP
jgi:uncharacterized protein HemY